MQRGAGGDIGGEVPDDASHGDSGGQRLAAKEPAGLGTTHLSLSFQGHCRAGGWRGLCEGKRGWAGDTEGAQSQFQEGQSPFLASLEVRPHPVFSEGEG